MQKCPKCYQTKRQNKAGRTASGSQRYHCMFCGCKYTPEKKRHGYDVQLRKQAIRLHVDGMNFRRTGRHVGVHHSSVSIWVKEHVNQLPETPQPKKVNTAEMDELFTFIGNQKTKST